MIGRVRPLSGRGKEIVWEQNGAVRRVLWGNTEVHISQDLIDDILIHYFTDPDHWYPLGASMTLPIPGGLGEYLRVKSRLNPRYATAVAAILVSEGLLECRGQKPIELRKHTADQEQPPR